ncbi:MAG TPA: SulP family inorganic anion transporter [Candidatus Nanoarchaeia archaeon]|nr:SulP family inorganic anion transporter [Candidatus Nanoarchaeia archaeon]
MNLHRLFKNFRGDVYGGITSAIVALPLALAFGIASGLGAEAGIYGAIVTGIISSIFGGTPVQITGPTAPITVLVATIVASKGIEFTLLVMLLAGILQIIMGVSRFGIIIEYIPHPVISGFMTGIAILIFTSQARQIFFSATTLFIVIFMVIAILIINRLNKKFNTAIPSFLFALLICSFIAVILNFNIPKVGAVPQEVPSIKIPGIDLQLLREAFVPALFVALLASIDTLLTSVICDSLTGARHNSNKELVGQGIGNSVNALFGGLAGAGATVRSVTNIKSGGKTRLSGIIHGLFLLAVVILLGRYAALIPLSVLAGILVFVSATMIDYDTLKNILKMPRPDVAVMLITIIVTVFVNLIAGVGVGLVLASLLFIKQMTELEIVRSSVKEHLTHDEIRAENVEELESRIAVYQVNGPLFFGAASTFSKEFSKVPKQKIIILKMFAVTSMDSTGAKALSDFNKRIKKKNKLLFITGIRPRVRDFFDEYGIINEIGRENLFAIPRQAIEKALKLI